MPRLPRPKLSLYIGAMQKSRLQQILPPQRVPHLWFMRQSTKNKAVWIIRKAKGLPNGSLSPPSEIKPQSSCTILSLLVLIQKFTLPALAPVLPACMLLQPPLTEANFSPGFSWPSWQTFGFPLPSWQHYLLFSIFYFSFCIFFFHIDTK